MKLRGAGRLVPPLYFPRLYLATSTPATTSKQINSYLPLFYHHVEGLASRAEGAKKGWSGLLTHLDCLLLPLLSSMLSKRPQCGTQCGIYADQSSDSSLIEHYDTISIPFRRLRPPNPITWEACTKNLWQIPPTNTTFILTSRRPKKALRRRSTSCSATLF